MDGSTHMTELSNFACIWAMPSLDPSQDTEYPD